MKELSNEVARLNQELGRMEGELITATDALLRSEKRKGSSEVDAIPLGQTSQGLSLTHTPSEPHAHPHSLQAVSSEQAEEDQSEPSQGCHLSAHLNAGAEKANWPVNGRLIDLEREVCAWEEEGGSTYLTLKLSTRSVRFPVMPVIFPSLVGVNR